MKATKILIQKEETARHIPLPQYMTPGSSGMDLCSAEQQAVVIPKGKVQLISTGIRLSMEAGYEAQIRPRSGLALKHGITLLNTPGTIDSDYRGIIKVIAINLGEKDFTVEPGMRIAQMVIQEVIRAEIEEVQSLDETVRAAGGFGSTGH